MRIMFVLKVQSAVYPFQKTGLFKIFNMSYTKYSLQPANGITKFLEEQWARFFKVFQSKEPEIILQDPQKRLEDSFLGKILFKFKVGGQKFYHCIYRFKTCQPSL